HRAKHPMRQVRLNLSPKPVFLLSYFFLSCFSIIGGQLPKAAGHPILTRVSQARQLSPHEAGQGYLVVFRGVVTYCDREAELFFIQDSTAGIFVNPAGMRVEGPEPIQPGDWVDVEGISAWVDYAPEIVQATVRVLGSAQMPPSRIVDLEHWTSGKEDSQWV